MVETDEIFFYCPRISPRTFIPGAYEEESFGSKNKVTLGLDGKLHCSTECKICIYKMPTKRTLFCYGHNEKGERIYSWHVRVGVSDPNGNTDCENGKWKGDKICSFCPLPYSIEE